MSHHALEDVPRGASGRPSKTVRRVRLRITRQIAARRKQYRELSRLPRHEHDDGMTIQAAIDYVSQWVDKASRDYSIRTTHAFGVDMQWGGPS